MYRCCAEPSGHTQTRLLDGQGAASCYGREIKLREGDLGGGLFVENLVCSGVRAILLSSYSVDRVRCELRELLGLITISPCYFSERK